MISKTIIDNVKEALYMAARNKKWCAACLEGYAHTEHIWCKGTLNLGNIEYVRLLIDNVMCDTTPTKFRIVEMLHYLASNGYIEQRQISESASMMGVVNIWITPKLYQEMQEAEKHQEENIGSWF